MELTSEQIARIIIEISRLPILSIRTNKSNDDDPENPKNCKLIISLIRKYESLSDIESQQLNKLIEDICEKYFPDEIEEEFISEIKKQLINKVIYE